MYPKACNGALYFDSHTLGATIHKLALVLMNIALERGFDAMVDAQTLTSQVMQGVVGNASLISISTQCFKVLDLMVFHLQNVEETYTIA